MKVTCILKFAAFLSLPSVIYAAMQPNRLESMVVETAAMADAACGRKSAEVAHPQSVVAGQAHSAIENESKQPETLNCIQARDNPDDPISNGLRAGIQQQEATILDAFFQNETLDILSEIFFELLTEEGTNSNCTSCNKKGRTNSDSEGGMDMVEGQMKLKAEKSVGNEKMANLNDESIEGCGELRNSQSNRATLTNKASSRIMQNGPTSYLSSAKQQSNEPKFHSSPAKTLTAGEKMLIALQTEGNVLRMKLKNIVHSMNKPKKCSAHAQLPKGRSKKRPECAQPSGNIFKIDPLPEKRMPGNLAKKSKPNTNWTAINEFQPDLTLKLFLNYHKKSGKGLQEGAISSIKKSASSLHAAEEHNIDNVVIAQRSGYDSTRHEVNERPASQFKVPLNFPELDEFKQEQPVQREELSETGMLLVQTENREEAIDSEQEKNGEILGAQQYQENRNYRCNGSPPCAWLVLAIFVSIIGSYVTVALYINKTKY